MGEIRGQSPNTGYFLSHNPNRSTKRKGNNPRYQDTRSLMRERPHQSRNYGRDVDLHIFDWSKVMFAPTGPLPSSPWRRGKISWISLCVPYVQHRQILLPPLQHRCRGNSLPGFSRPGRDYSFYPRIRCIRGHGTGEDEGSGSSRVHGSIFPSSRNFFTCRGVYFIIDFIVPVISYLYL